MCRDEETCRAFFLLAHEILTAAGYGHYEISNYAKPGRESRHNTLYWRNGYYIGLGAAAAGHVPGIRYTNKADLQAYMTDLENGRKPEEEREAIGPQLAMAEELMLAFRLAQGVHKAQFRERWGADLWQVHGGALEKHLAAGLLVEDDARISPTLAGWLTYDVWVPDFL